MFLFVQLLIILLATKVAGHISVRCGQPSVLGKLISGIVIGPAVLGWIVPGQLIEQLSTVGVLLLMFLAGLETDLGTMNKNRTSSLAVAVGGIALPLAGGWLGGQWLGMGQLDAIFLGLLFSATSVSISVQTLKELNQLHTRQSATILGAAIADDILVIIMLAIFMSVAHAAEVSVAMLVGKKLVFFIGAWLLGCKAVPIVMDKLSLLRVSQAAVSAALIICFAFSYLAELLGITGIIGAFFAGLAIARTNYRRQIEEAIEPVAYTVFVPVFFVSIGLVVSFAGVGQQLWFIAAATVVAVLTKLVGCGLGARITGFDAQSALCIGAGMVSRGEVALILAVLGREARLLTESYFTAVVIVIILTTLITPPLLKQCFSNDSKPCDDISE